jgi:hypothetical protein
MNRARKATMGWSRRGARLYSGAVLRRIPSSLSLLGLLAAAACNSSSNSPSSATTLDGSVEDSPSVAPDAAGVPVEAGSDGGKGPGSRTRVDAGSDGSDETDAGDGAATSCNSLTLGTTGAPFANVDAGTFPTGTGGTVVPGTYSLSAINLYGDTGTVAASMGTATMTMVLEQGDAGQTFVGQIIYDQTGGGYTATMDVTFTSNQYEATYTCVDPLQTLFGALSVTPPGDDGDAVAYTYDAASMTLHLYNGYGAGYGTPGNPRLYEEVLVLRP